MKIFKKIMLMFMMLFSFQMALAKEKDFSNIKLKDLNNTEYSFGEIKKDTYVKLWASWCHVCLYGLEEINELSKGDKNFEIVTIVFPSKNGEKSVKDFKKWYNSLGYNNIKVLVDEKGEILKHINPRAFPTSVILDKDAKVKKVLIGHMDNNKIKSFFPAPIMNKEMTKEKMDSMKKKTTLDMNSQDEKMQKKKMM